MQAAKDKVVVIDYTLTDDDGVVIDQNVDGTFAYLHGANNLIPGLERELEGKLAGDSLSVSVEPVHAYGERDLAQIQRVPRNMFPEDAEIEAGMQFHAQSPEGAMMVVTVDSLDGDQVVVDGNHPLAGKTLHFEVAVKDVRDATEEELEHGHVHGPGGHNH